MGCDIHPHVEVKTNGKWEISTKDVFSLDDFDKKDYKKEKCNSPFDWRSYSMFGFLAGVRETCNPISDPKGLPDDISEEVKKEHEYMDMDAHSESFLTLKELSDFDYDKQVISSVNEIKTYRDFLSEMYFTHLSELKTLGEPENVRVVFWFDN